MSPNPFLRGYDKLSIELIVHDLQAGSTVREMSYVIHAQDQEHTLVLGIQPTLELARDIVQRLSFETGHFSRCWEISAEHLPEDVLNQLFLMRTDLHALQLEFFENANQSVIGCKLRNTPWTDQHLDLFNTSSVSCVSSSWTMGCPPNSWRSSTWQGRPMCAFCCSTRMRRCWMGCQCSRTWRKPLTTLHPSATLRVYTR